jgi:hypothetical protein
MTFETETYGRYDIRSGPLKDSWAANGFRRKKRVAEAMAGTRNEAIGHVKAELDRLDAIEASSHDSEGAPPSAIYQEAFVAALPTIPPSYIAMLKAHLAAPDYLISATKLAEAAGYAGYEGANLHYGKLGALIAGGRSTSRLPNARTVPRSGPARSHGIRLRTLISLTHRSWTRAREISGRRTSNGSCVRRSCRRSRRSGIRHLLCITHARGRNPRRRRPGPARRSSGEWRGCG